MAEPRWTPEAEAAVAKAPFFIRGVARRAVLKAAEAEGVEPAMVMNNQVLQEASVRRPREPEDMAEMPGVRRWQLKRYAADLVAQVARFDGGGA